jgi:hypothetical protein
MGYRSQLAYIIEFHNVQDRDAFVALMLAKNEEALTEAIIDTDHGYAKPLITYQAEDVKWYPDYPYVKAHTHIYASAKELYDAAYKFVRLGEDDDDVEQEWEADKAYKLNVPFNCLNLVRSIDFDL